MQGVELRVGAQELRFRVYSPPQVDRIIMALGIFK